jgi:NNP family nitrate/nitrite transporter-like MFS transporter
VTIGFGLNIKAWLLLSPHLFWRFGVGSAEYALLMGLPLIVGALVRLPAGLLTDRYGARIMFPVVNLAGAASACGLGLSGSLPAAAVAGAAAGTASAAFVVGASVVARTFPYGRRGVALGVFALGGTAVVTVVSILSRWLDPDGRRAAVVLGGRRSRPGRSCPPAADCALS